MKTFIYILKCPTTGNIRYVGKTIDLKRRYYHHLSNAKNKKKSHVWWWIKKLKGKGLKPVIQTIEECGDNWADRERHWISYYREVGCRLCNLTDGGEGLLGYKPSKETREKISKNNGRGSIKTVYQFNKNGTLICEYDSTTTAANKTGLPQNGIAKCCRGEYMYVGGYYWSYNKKFEGKDKLSHWARSVIKVDIESGRELKEYISLRHAEADTSISRNNIRAVCRNRAITAGGFIWKYKNAA